MRRISSTILIAAAAGSLSACATITRGSTEKLVIQSDPPGATAMITGGIKLNCITPCDITLKRKDDYFVEIRLVGYETSYNYLQAHVDAKGRASAVGNVLTGGIVGMGVDTMTGAARVHTPNPLMVKLAPRLPSNHADDPNGVERR
jgi:PEGA domain